MKINRKIQNIVLAVAGGIALIGFILGSFLDQACTAKLGDANNLFGILLTAFGPIIGCAFGVFAGCILFFMPKLENKKWDIALRIIGIAAIVGFFLFQIKEGKAYTDDEFVIMQLHKTTYVVLIIVFIGLLDLFLLLFSRFWVKKMDSSQIVLVAVLILSVILCYVILCEGIKYLASRPRPRVIAVNEAITFKQWYEFQPFSAFKSEFKDCKSFVSGHSANAACLITLVPLVATLSKKENSAKIQIICGIIGILFTYVVSISRIVATAHWLTDVAGGIILSVGVQALVINLAPKVIAKFKK